VPVGTTKVAVAQSIADRVDRTVNVAQPVACQRPNDTIQYNKSLMKKTDLTQIHNIKCTGE